VKTAIRQIPQNFGALSVALLVGSEKVGVQKCYGHALSACKVRWRFAVVGDGKVRSFCLCVFEPEHLIDVFGYLGAFTVRAIYIVAIYCWILMRFSSFLEEETA